MGSDRARNSYDSRQLYRSVVMQQGRVQLEADWNEAQFLAGEEMRKQALDIVGAAGTPDNGYAVTFPPNLPAFDFEVGAGIMYVGGVRVWAPRPIRYGRQSDWLDAAIDPEWVPVPTANPGNEYIFLLVREQEVSAVEDSDLKDVALGGPDTAQRTRLVQHVERQATQATDCAAALQAARKQWAQEGLFFDPGTMRLQSHDRLQVSFVSSGGGTLCDPTAQGGYLGADNQMIRVQIASYSAATKTGTLLWGFDDASFLYRVNVVDPQTLTLQSAPVDAEHQPQGGQAVEVLMDAAELSNGQYVAAPVGAPFVLGASPYNPDNLQLSLPSPGLPAVYGNGTPSPANPPQVYLRIWQQQLNFTSGTAVTLGDTGVAITLDIPAGAHVGDYWMFAVRPSTPQKVYPERYLAAPQPPEGARLWVCPLAVITWRKNGGTVLADCRNQFGNLVGLGKGQQGCCTFTVRPQDLTGGTTLQSIVYQASNPTMLVEAANPGAAGDNITVQISNLQLNATPATFDLTVTQTDTYLGVSSATASSEIGAQGGSLASVQSSAGAGVPLDNQTVQFTGGQDPSGGGAGSTAEANVMDSSNQKKVFTLQARGPGADGNATWAAVSNVNPSVGTFDLTVGWQKTLTGLSMSTLFQSIAAGMAYEITATAPVTVAPTYPSEGVTPLSGGLDGDSNFVEAATAEASIYGNPSKICLRPGTYNLDQPLVLGPEQSNITIEACGGATLAPAQEDASAFAQGMIHLNGANNITLCGLTFTMPRVSLLQTGLSLAGLNTKELESIGETDVLSLNSSFALAVSGCQGLAVEECTFNFPGMQLDELLFGAAVFAGADCAYITLKNNVFQGPAAVRGQGLNTASTTLSSPLTAGYLQADSLQSLQSGAATGGTLIPSTLDNLIISNNTFDNLSYPVFILTTLGSARMEGNIVRASASGFTILPLGGILADAAALSRNSAASLVLSNAPTQRFVSLAVAYPRPATFVPRRRVVLKTQAKPAAAGQPVPPQPAAATFKAEALSPLALREADFYNGITGSAFFFVVFQFRVVFSNNDVDTSSFPTFSLPSLWALMIVDIDALEGSQQQDPQTTFGILTLTGNQLISAWAGQATYTVSVMVQFCAAAGNAIINRSGGSLQILVPNNTGTAPANDADAAATGNVLIGTANLPPREAQPQGAPPLPAWTTYNYYPQ